MDHIEKEEDVLIQLLIENFPDYKWRTSIRRYLKKSQYMLKESLKEIFPGQGNEML